MQYWILKQVQDDPTPGLLLAVKFFVNVAQLFIGHMRVYLRSLNICMTKHYLHTANVGAVLQKISSKAVPKNMRSDFAGNAGLYCILLDHAFDRAGSEPSSLPAFACF